MRAIDVNQRCETVAEGAAFGLLALVSGISEEYWCAGWLKGLEFDLWHAVARAEYGQGTITLRQAMLLRALSEECGGWWFWRNDDSDGPELIALDVWKRIVDETGNTNRV